MSCFKLQEWWSVQAGADEEFAAGAMVVGNLDNAPPSAAGNGSTDGSELAPSNKVAVGSLQGMLRVYCPARPEFRVDDLLVEADLGQPVLQLLSGQFLPMSSHLAIAVLHPRSLVV